MGLIKNYLGKRVHSGVATIGQRWYRNGMVPIQCSMALVRYGTYTGRNGAGTVHVQYGMALVGYVYSTVWRLYDTYLQIQYGMAMVRYIPIRYCRR